MRFSKILIFLALAALAVALVAGCSEDQKQEAAKLEEELARQQEGTDTSVPETEGAVDTGEEAMAETMDAQAIPEEETADIPTGPAGSGYAVQVASCESMDYAQYLVEKYRTRGYEPYITNYNHEGQTYYRVRLGPYDTQGEAQDVKMQLLDRYSLQTWIDVES